MEKNERNFLAIKVNKKKLLVKNNLIFLVLFYFVSLLCITLMYISLLMLLVNH